MSFSKVNRIAKESEFRKVLRKGVSIRRGPVRLFFLKSPSGRSRLGLRVSKRDFKRAVDRNLLKRRVREFFRKRKGSFLFPCDLIVQVGTGRTEKLSRDTAVPAKKLKVDTWIEASLKEAGLL